MKQTVLRCLLGVFALFVAGCKPATAMPAFTPQDVNFQTAVPIQVFPQLFMFVDEEKELRIHAQFI